MVIYGDQSVSSVESRRSLKLKWKEIAQITSRASKKPASSRKPLFFSDDDFLTGEPNEFIPLIISASILKRDVKRILVDQGSSTDVMFQDLLPKLGLSVTDLSQYRGGDVSSLGPERTRPIGSLEVLITYGRRKLTRTVKTLSFPFHRKPKRSPFAKSSFTSASPWSSSPPWSFAAVTSVSSVTLHVTSSLSPSVLRESLSLTLVPFLSLTSVNVSLSLLGMAKNSPLSLSGPMVRR